MFKPMQVYVFHFVLIYTSLSDFLTYLTYIIYSH